MIHEVSKYDLRISDLWMTFSMLGEGVFWTKWVYPQSGTTGDDCTIIFTCNRLLARCRHLIHSN